MWRSEAGFFIFYLGRLRCPPKVTPFFEDSTETTHSKIRLKKRKNLEGRYSA